MPKLTIITGNGTSGKSGRLTFLANNDPAGCYLGPSLGNGAWGVRSQSRYIALQPETPFILTKDKLPDTSEIKKQYPKIKNIYVDEAQHLYPDGIETKDVIFAYLAANFNVFAAGVFHNRPNYEPLLDRADEIFFLKGGYINMDDSPPDEIKEREDRINYYIRKYKDKLQIIDHQFYINMSEDTGQCR
jgi:hypothetical protein